jgi:thioredoxin reductase (NADPH)
MERSDLVIVGAGPIGIELAVELKRRGIDYLHMEAGQVGSTIGWWAPGTTFFSTANHIAISGMPLAVPDQQKPSRELYLSYLRSVVQQFELDIRTYTRVVGVERLASGGFELTTRPSFHGVGGPEEYSLHRSAQPVGAGRDKIVCNRLVLSIGNMHLPRELNVPGEDLPQVSHFLEDPHRYFQKQVLIVGGRNSAAGAALRLYRSDCRLTLSCRGRGLDSDQIKWWLYPELAGLIELGEIRFVPSSEVISIEPDHCRLIVKGGESEIKVPADFVLLMIGYRQVPTLFEMAGVTLEPDGGKPRYDPETMESNVPGLFVCGTAVSGTPPPGVGQPEFIQTSHVHVERIARALCR